MAEVGSAYVSILPSARGFGNKLSSQVGGEVNSSGTRLGRGFGRVFGLAAGAVAAVGIGSFFKGAIDGASDLNEAGTKIDAIFGKGSQAVQDFAGKGAKALGQTRLEVLNASATFGTFGKAAGLSGGDLAKFSTDFAGLSTDLASFNNTSPEEAVTAIGAALRGESEPIRQFGVLLDDATLRNEALKLGLISSTKEALTPQQKVLAAQAAIYKQTGDAQGDFQKTSGGLANQQRILSASFKDAQAQLGTALLPAAVKVVTFLNKNMGPAFTAISGFLSGPVKSAVLGFASAIQSMFSGGAGGGFLATLKSVGASIQTNFLPVLQTAANTFKTVVLPAITALGQYLAAKLFPVFTQVAGIIRDQVIPIAASLALFFYGTLVPAVYAIVTSIAQKLRPVFDQLVATFTGSVLPTVQKVLVKFREWQPTIQKVIAVVVKIIGKVLEFAAAILGKVLPPLIRFQVFMVTYVVSAVIAVIGIIVKVIAKVVAFGKAFISAKDKAVAAARAILEPIQPIIDKLRDLVSYVSDKVMAIWGGLKSAGKGAFDAIASAVQWVIDKVQALIDKIQSIPGIPGGNKSGNGTFVGATPKSSAPSLSKSLTAPQAMSSTFSAGGSAMSSSEVLSELRALRQAVGLQGREFGREINGAHVAGNRGRVA